MFLFLSLQFHPDCKRLPLLSSPLWGLRPAPRLWDGQPPLPAGLRAEAEGCASMPLLPPTFPGAWALARRGPSRGRSSWGCSQAPAGTLPPGPSVEAALSSAPVPFALPLRVWGTASVFWPGRSCLHGGPRMEPGRPRPPGRVRGPDAGPWEGLGVACPRQAHGRQCACVRGPCALNGRTPRCPRSMQAGEGD